MSFEHVVDDVLQLITLCDLKLYDHTFDQYIFLVNVTP